MANDPNRKNFRSVPKFFKDFQPHLPFRFVAQFFTGGDTAQYAAGLQFAISSLKFGSIDCDTSTGAFYFGNGYHTIPIYDTSSRTIDITFEETDDMQVIKLLDAIAEKQRFGLPYVVGIGITEFEEHMSKEVHQRLYVCVLSSYDEPSFSRSGGVSLVTVNATFNVMSEQLWTGAAPKTAFGEQAATNPDGGLASELRQKGSKTKSSGFGENMSQWAADFAGDLAAGKKREAEKAKEEEKKKDEDKKGSGGSGGSDTNLRPKSKKTKELQDKEKLAAKNAGTSYLAMAMANGGEGDLKGEAFAQRSEITDAEIAKAKKLDAELSKAKGGEQLKQFVEELSDKQYWLGHKGKDGVISGTEGLDCSGAAGAWAERMGYNINEGTAGAKNGGLVKQLVEQGAVDVGQNYDTGLKAGDILNKTSTKEGNTGHVVIFLGYDKAGNMLIAESAGRTGEGNDQSAGGRVRTVSIAGMKKAGYTAVKIMDNAKPRK